MERAAGVGIYLNDMMQEADGSYSLSVVYQFTFDDRDLILTDDPIRYAPTLFPNIFTFSVAMTITAGRGVFEPYAGHKSLNLDATVTFGPPETPGGPPTLVEQFTVGGQLCLP